MQPKILVVDDSPSVRQQVSLALTQAGFEVVEAVDGVDGLEKVHRMADIKAIVCDINMPRMNGLEMVQKALAGMTRKLPIVMLTTEGDPALVQRARQAGAKGWITKPFKAELLVATLKKLTS